MLLDVASAHINKNNAHVFCPPLQYNLLADYDIPKSPLHPLAFLVRYRSHELLSQHLKSVCPCQVLRLSHTLGAFDPLRCNHVPTSLFHGVFKETCAKVGSVGCDDTVLCGHCGVIKYGFQGFRISVQVNLNARREQKEPR